MSEGLERLYSYLPPYYQKSKIMRMILTVEGDEFDRFRGLINDTDAQQYVLTGTWGLDNWERLFGLPVDRSRPINERRERILAKRRSVTAKLIDVLRAVEPTLQAAFGGYIIPFTLRPPHNAEEYDKFGELILLLEDWKPAVYSYSFTVIPPDRTSGYTAYADHAVSRDKINFVPETGTFRSGRWPRWNSPGTLRKSVTEVRLSLSHGLGQYRRAAMIYSGPTMGKSSAGSAQSAVIVVRPESLSASAVFRRAGADRAGVNPFVSAIGSQRRSSIYFTGLRLVGLSRFLRSGLTRSGTFPFTVIDGFRHKSYVRISGSTLTGAGKFFPCGLYHAGEEVA